MKFIKWKILILSCIVCLLPILPAVVLWDKLPDTMPIHFNLYFEADKFASKGFAVFALPLIMMLGQIFCCVTTDLNAHKQSNKKYEFAVKWIIPVLTIILHTVTIMYSMNI